MPPSRAPSRSWSTTLILRQTNLPSPYQPCYGPTSHAPLYSNLAYTTCASWDTTALSSKFPMCFFLTSKPQPPKALTTRRCVASSLPCLPSPTRSWHLPLHLTSLSGRESMLIVQLSATINRSCRHRWPRVLVLGGGTQYIRVSKSSYVTK